MPSSLPGNKDNIFNSFAAFNSFILVVYGNCTRTAKVSIIHISIQRLLNILYSNHLSIRSLGYQAVKSKMKMGFEVNSFYL
jgi:hypothetical protein